MGLASTLNGQGRRTVADGIDTKVLTYLKAEELAKTEPPYPLRLRGFFCKDGDYGRNCTLIVQDFKGEVYGVNVPKRYADKFDGLTDEQIEGLLSGDTGISSITPDFKTPKGKTTMIEFCDMEPEELPFK